MILAPSLVVVLLVVGVAVMARGVAGAALDRVPLVFLGWHVAAGASALAVACVVAERTSLLGACLAVMAMGVGVARTFRLRPAAG